MIRILIFFTILLSCNLSDAKRLDEMDSNTSPDITNDLIYSQDVSDTSEASTGTGKKLTIKNLLKAGQITVDGTNVGIYTLAPAQRLHVVGTVQATSFIGDGSGLTGVAASASDNPYGIAWDGDVSGIASKNAIYDKIESVIAGDNGGWSISGTDLYATTTTNNVAIGTTVSTEKLTVVGNISSTGSISSSGTESYIETSELSADPATPNPGKARIFSKNDQSLYYIDSNGLVSDLLAGGSGSVTINTTSPMTGAGTGSSFTLGVDQSKLTLSSIGGAVTDSQVPDNITITGFSGTSSGTNTGDQTTITGNAGTATALAANGSNCSTGSAAEGVDASGASENCLDFIQQTELLDEDTMTSNSATQPASQRSIKAYVDTAISGVSGGAGGWTDGGSNVYLTTTTDTVGIGTTGASGSLEIVKQGSAVPLMVSATATGDGNYLIVDSAGNVGIGTVIPKNSLDIQSTLTTARVVSTTTGGASSGGSFAVVAKTAAAMTLDQRLGAFFFGGSTSAANGVGTAASLEGYAEGTWTTSSAPSRFAFYTVPSGVLTRKERMRIDSTGNIGVGTYYPNGRLTVFGSSTGAVPIQTWKDSGNTQRMAVLGNGTVGIGTAGPRSMLDVAGDVTVGNGTFTNTSANEDLYVEGNLEVDGTIYGDGSQLTGIAAGGWVDGGTNVYVSPTTDNVGIGTTTPSTNFKADVRGNLYVSGNVGIGTLLPRGTLDLGPTGTIYTQTITGPTGPTILGTANNVGVGTTTAGSLLTVGSTGQLTVSSAGALSTSSTVTVATEAYDDAGWNGDNSVPTKDALRDKIETLVTGGWTDGGTNIYLTTSTDSVGIGSTNPEKRLVIYSGAGQEATMRLRATDADVGYAEIGARNDLNNEIVLGLAPSSADDGNTNGRGYIYMDGANSPMTFSTNATERMRIDSSGNIGIGTTNPESAMQVNSVLRSFPTDTPGTCNATCEGCIYYDNSLNEFCDCDGSSWAQVDGGGAC